MIFFFNFLCFLDSFHGSLYWGCQKYSSDFLVQDVQGVSRVGILKMFRWYNLTFLTLRRGTIFQAKGGVQSRTTKAKGGIPPLPPLWTHMSLVYNTTQQSLPHHPKGLNYNPVVWPEMGQTKPTNWVLSNTNFPVAHYQFCIFVHYMLESAMGENYFPNKMIIGIHCHHNFY